MTLTTSSPTSPDVEAAERLTIVSIDGHAGPPVRDYADYVDPAFTDQYRDYVAQVEGYDEARQAEAQAPADDGSNRAYGRAGRNSPIPGLWDPQTRLSSLDDDGIAAEVFYPQNAIPFHPYPALGNAEGRVEFSEDPSVLQAGIHAYNRWLSDMCSAAPDRFIGVGVVPIGDIDKAVVEAEWIASSHLRGGLSLPPIVPTRPAYNDPRYEPFWAACEDLGLPLNVHGGGMATYFGTGPEAMALRFAETDWYMHRTLWFLIFSGVFERHPGLRLVFTEVRAEWVVPTLEKLDSIYEAKLANVKGFLSRKPSEYFRQNCFIGASFMSRREAECREVIGRHNLMWGRDYPHREGCWPWTLESIRKTFAGLPIDDVRLMLGNNAIDCYQLDRERLAEVAARVGPTVEQVEEPLLARPSDADYSWGFREMGPFA